MIRSLLEQITTQAESADASLLVALVDAIRPAGGAPLDHARLALVELTGLLREEPALADGLRRYLGNVLAARQHRYLYSDVGVIEPEGLRAGLSRRLARKWLPDAPHPAYLRDLFAELFDHASDPQWVHAIALSLWHEAWRALEWERLDEGCGELQAGRTSGREIARIEVLEALRVLTLRLLADAQDPEILRLHATDRADVGPFRALDSAIAAWVEALRTTPAERDPAQPLTRAVPACLEACERALAGMRRLLRQNGTTAALNQRLLRMGQMVARLRVLVQLTGAPPGAERELRAIRLFQKLVEEQSGQASLRQWWQRTTNLLALRVTEQAGRTGEHYVAWLRSEWFTMARAALGAGVVVGFMALIKILITRLGLPPLWNALAISMNYATGFVLVHLLHFTIATKQPAMTAALIASSVKVNRRGQRSLVRLADLMIAIARTQFVAIAGNVIAAFPMALVIFYVLGATIGPEWLGLHKAQVMLEDQHPFASPALVFAAIAGVCLFLAGVVSGYYDNLTAVARVPQRIERARWLGWLAPPRRRRVADYVENNLGALAGNIAFGFMLGMTGFIGFLLGLPIDIRHVTFSAANLAFGAAAGGWQLGWQLFVVLAAGVLLIGLINLLTSFSLALWTALRANNVRVRDTRRLLTLLGRRIKRRPLDLFWPPK